MVPDFFFEYRNKISNKGRNVDNIHGVNAISIIEFNHFRFKSSLLNPLLAIIVCNCIHLSFFSHGVRKPYLLFRSCSATSSVPDSLCFPFFTQAINEILSTSPCHCLVGFPLHPSIASFPLCAPASTAHSLSALLSSFRLSGSPPLRMTSLLLACTLFSLL